MTDTVNRAAVDGLRFFGLMSAAISHDLKNTLSIINESAGLIEDLALLAKTGRQLDAQRIGQLGATIKRQIQRSDGIVRNLNRFAHSLDDPFKEIGLGAMLDMLLDICRRLIDARGIAVSVDPCGPEVSITTRPFLLLQFLWLLLEWGLDNADAGKSLVLQLDPSPASVRLACRGIAGLAADAAELFPPTKWRDLLELLGARMEIATAGQREVTAIVPRRIDT